MGTNLIEAVVVTAAGYELRSQRSVQVVDTTAPVIDARIVDLRTGQELSSIDKNGMTFVTVKINAADVCDPDPEVESMLGTEIKDGAGLGIIGQANQLRLETNKISLKVMAADASGNWQSANFPGQLDQPAISGPTATPAGDGMPNLLKYAFGRQPLIPASGAPVSLFLGGTTIFRYQRPSNRPDLVYLVETSADLTTWNSATMVQNRILQTSGMETWEVVIPESDPLQRFMRVKVTND